MKEENEEYLNSEYSKKGSIFYISPAKWRRLAGRCCRVRAEVHLMGKMGEYEIMKLDTDKCDSIGMTRKSLDDWMKKWKFVRPPFVMYWIAKWRITPA